MSAHLLLLLLLVPLATSASSGNRIWLVAIGHDWGGHEYFDDSGYLQGYGFGLLDLVCTQNFMDCRMVWDRYPNCWDSSAGQHPSGGRGLMARWYDACMGWVPTVERIHTLAFSLAYLKQPYTYFFVRKGRTAQFDANDVTNMKIGFLDGWASTEQCLARQTSIRGRILELSQIKHYTNPKDIYDAVMNSQVDAAFGSEDTWTPEQRATLDRVNKQMSCYLGGNGMMARKDSEFISYWNTGFTRLRDGNKFNKFCEEANKKHGHKGTVDCITL